MSFVRYDESAIITALEQFPVRLRATFAALCAERLLPAYILFGEQIDACDSRALIAILQRIWQYLEGNEMSAEELQTNLDTCIDLIPKEDEGEWVEQKAYAEDASSAVAYALRTIQNGEPQEAAWAARHAYETLDYYLTYREGPHTTDISEIERTMTHPLVQAELLRQQRDLDDLRKIAKTDDQAPLLAELRSRAQADAIRFFGEVDS